MLMMFLFESERFGTCLDPVSLVKHYSGSFPILTKFLFEAKRFKNVFGIAFF